MIVYFGESLRNIRNKYTLIFPIVCVLSSGLSGPRLCRGVQKMWVWADSHEDAGHSTAHTFLGIHHLLTVPV